jgi:hypothetical protein
MLLVCDLDVATIIAAAVRNCGAVMTVSLQTVAPIIFAAHHSASCHVYAKYMRKILYSKPVGTVRSVDSHVD